MGGPELYPPLELPDTEAMDMYPLLSGQTLKKLVVGALGGNEPFFHDLEPAESSITDWEKWSETADLRMELAEQKRLRAEHAKLERLYWLSCMELGHARDDEAPAVAIKPMPKPEFDVPSFMRQAHIPSIHAEAAPLKDKDGKPAVVTDLATKRLEHDAALPPDQLGINRRAALVIASKMAFTEPAPAFLDGLKNDPVNHDAVRESLTVQKPNIIIEPAASLTGESQANIMPSPSATKVDTVQEAEPLTPDKIKFVQLLTRAELIVRYAERYATTKGKLPSLWRLERIISKDARHRSLLANKPFMDTLRGYEAMGREDFVSEIKELLQHQEYGREACQRVRTTHLKDLGAKDPLVPATQEELEHGK